MKKNKIYLLVMGIILINFLIINNLNMKFFEDDVLLTATCHEPGVIKAFRILAYVIEILRLLVPAIIILTGIKSGYALVITEQDGGSKKLARLIIEKFCIGVFAFFIPTIVGAIMSSISDYDKTDTKYTDCGQCLNSVEKCNELLNDYDK